MGVAVLEEGGGEQGAVVAEDLGDGGVGFEDGLIGEGVRSAVGLSGEVALAAGVVDELEFGQVVALAGVKVVDAVGGRGVDGAGALVGGDVVSVDAEDGAVQEGMLEGGAVEA